MDRGHATPDHKSEHDPPTHRLQPRREGDGFHARLVAGQAALGPDFSIVGGGDLEAQTRQVMTNLQHALDELGAGWEDVVKATVYTTLPHEFETIGRAMKDTMGDAEPPAQVIAGVTGLALPELLIEIELVVSLP